MRKDHRAEGRPGGDAHRDLRRDVGILGEAAGFKRRSVITNANEVAITDKEGDDVVGVGLYPGGNIYKILLRGACVK